MTTPDPRNGGAYDSGTLLRTDRERHADTLTRREDAARDMLEAIGAVLDRASTAIDDLERDRLLGQAITRYCADLADVASRVAAEIGDRTEDERLELARACLRDARDELALTDGGSSVGDDATAAAAASAGGAAPSSSSCGANTSGGAAADAAATTDVATRSAAEAMANLTEEDVVAAVNLAETILLDVAEVLRSVGQDEAEEIADVGLTVAKMFVWSLRSMHGRVTPQILAGTDQERGLADSLGIEILDEDDGCLDGRHESTSTASSLSSTTNTNGGLPDRRMRVLWPPLGPAVASAGRWGADAATKNPILSVALGMALWPTAVVGAFIGAPLLAADWALQRGYECAKDGPVVKVAEKGAANLYDVGKLYYLCGKLVVRQGLRVGQRQVERRGGLGAVAKEIGGLALDRALHPVETAAMTWDGLKWGAGAIVDATMFVKSVATGEVTVNGVPAELH